jgi:hypothetical protein
MYMCYINVFIYMCLYNRVCIHVFLYKCLYTCYIYVLYTCVYIHSLYTCVYVPLYTCVQSGIVAVYKRESAVSMSDPLGWNEGG